MGRELSGAILGQVRRTSLFWLISALRLLSRILILACFVEMRNAWQFSFQHALVVLAELLRMKNAGFVGDAGKAVEVYIAKYCTPGLTR
jgi:hypothetical protein